MNDVHLTTFDVRAAVEAIAIQPGAYAKLPYIPGAGRAAGAPLRAGRC
jgi:hypothetical protein